MAQRFEGKNLEDALSNAAQTLGVERYQLTYHVLMEKRGFLGGMRRSHSSQRKLRNRRLSLKSLRRSAIGASGRSLWLDSSSRCELRRTKNKSWFDSTGPMRGG